MFAFRNGDWLLVVSYQLLVGQGWLRHCDSDVPPIPAFPLQGGRGKTHPSLALPSQGEERGQEGQTLFAFALGGPWVWVHRCPCRFWPSRVVSK